MIEVTRFETASGVVDSGLTDVYSVDVIGQPVTLILEFQNDDAASSAVDQFQVQLKSHVNGAYYTWLDTADFANQVFDNGIATTASGSIKQCHIDMTNAGAPTSIKIRAASGENISSSFLRGSLSTTAIKIAGNFGDFAV